MEKPRVKLGSVAWLLQTFIGKRSQPGSRPLGASQGYTLSRIQRSPMGEKQLSTLKAMDFIEHCTARKASGVIAATILHDMTCLSGVLKYGHEILEIEDAEKAYKAWKKAKPQLMKEQLIGKSTPRTRRPLQEELDILIAHFSAPPKIKMEKLIYMVPIIKFSYMTARRISETCRLTWGDVNHEKRTCIVRDLKNPKGKGFHDEFPLLGEAYDIVMAQPRLTENPNERIFKYCAKSCSAKYTRAKKALAKLHPGMFLDLHLHDNRRETVSRLFEAGYSVPEVGKVSLHRNPTVLLGTYTALKAEDLHRGPASKRVAAV